VPALHGDTRRRPHDRLDVKHGDRRPRRIRRSRDVAACFGLTSKRWQSGTSIDVQGRIRKAGDPEVRRALYEAASAMLTRHKGKSALKSWGPKIAKRCHKKAGRSDGRKLAVIMHGMWRDRTVYADRQHADDMSDAAPTAKDRTLLGAQA
jgi:transposase